MVRYCIKCGRKNTHNGECCQFCGAAFAQPVPVKEPMQIVDEEDPRLSCPSTEEVDEMAGTIERMSNQIGSSDQNLTQRMETIRGYRLDQIVRK